MIRSGFLGLLIGAALPLSAVAQQDFSLQWRGYAQLTAERQQGPANALRTDVERVRPRIVVDSGRWSALMQMDFAVNDLGEDPPGTLANVILDLYGSYRLEGKHAVRLGQFKTPLGMDFNLPAHQLDITKRGMDTGLVLNRTLGIMLTGEQILEGLSYDIGIFNPPGRSGATGYFDSQVGDAVGQAARLRFDRASWHAEIAHGIAEEAGGLGTADYAVSNIALRYSRQAWTIKAEWTEGRDLLGVAGREESVRYLHIGYDLTPGLELVARHYMGRSRIAAMTTELDNTYVGLTKNIATQTRLQARLQANYVLANGDRTSYTGLRGFREDALQVQLLLYVEN